MKWITNGICILFLKIDEQQCKDNCYGWKDKITKKRCTHYKFHQKRTRETHEDDNKCIFYEVDTSKSVQYNCDMHAADKYIDPENTAGASNRSIINDLPTCLQDVKTIGDGGGGITTEGPGGSITTTTKNKDEGPDGEG